MRYSIEETKIESPIGDTDGFKVTIKDGFELVYENEVETLGIAFEIIARFQNAREEFINDLKELGDDLIDVRTINPYGSEHSIASICVPELVRPSD